MKFLAFVSSNLDEFFEIRVAGVIQQIKSRILNAMMMDSIPKALLAKIQSYVKKILVDHTNCWKNVLTPKLEALGICFFNVQ